MEKTLKEKIEDIIEIIDNRQDELKKESENFSNSKSYSLATTFSVLEVVKLRLLKALS